MKKRILKLGAVALLALGLASCDLKSTDATSDNNIIGKAYYMSEVQDLRSFNPLRDRLDGLGFTLEHVNHYNHMEHDDIVESFKDNYSGYIVRRQGGCEAFYENDDIIELLKDNNKPIVIRNHFDDYYKGSFSKKASIAYKMEALGIEMSNLVKAYIDNHSIEEIDLNNDKTIGLVYIFGNIDNKENIKEYEATINDLSKYIELKGYRLEILDKLDSRNIIGDEYNHLITQEHALESYKRHNDKIDLIIAPDDELAMGALFADEKYNTNALIFARSIKEDIKELVKSGRIAGSLIPNYELEAEVISRLFTNLVEGREFFSGLNSVSLEDYIDNGRNYYIDMNKQAVYLHYNSYFK